MTHEPSRSFDERAALDRVERFQEQIREARRRRQHATEQFEAFVRRGSRSVVEASPAARAEGPAPPVDMPAPPAAVWRPKEPRRSDTGRVFGRRTAIAAAVVLVILPVAAYRWWGPPSRTAERPAAAPGAQDAMPAPARVPEPAVPSSAAPPPATAAAARAMPARPGLELMTDRQVWVRVTVDGRVAVERELPPGQHLRFDFQRAVTIRAGDAGAVRLTIAGREEGPMGPTGQVRNRTILAARSEP